ncbi:MAG TPA: hypothetical protein VL501_09505, partial [Pyrinomonadaceae bacterium]|nr:hypothetical protein [Pyrinomonadaceae bacterium]
MRSKALFISALAIPVMAVAAAAQATTYKITQKIGMQGHDMTSTTWVKGPRKRTLQGGMMGMGGDVATI